MLNLKQADNIKSQSIKGICVRFRQVCVNTAFENKTRHSSKEWQEQKNYILTGDRYRICSFSFISSLLLQDPAYLAFSFGLALGVISSVGFFINLLLKVSGLLDEGYHTESKQVEFIRSIFQFVYKYDIDHQGIYAILSTTFILVSYIGFAILIYFLIFRQPLKIRISRRNGTDNLPKKYQWISYILGGFRYFLFLSLFMGLCFRAFPGIPYTIGYIFVAFIYAVWIWLLAPNSTDRLIYTIISVMHFIVIPLFALVLGFIFSNVLPSLSWDTINNILIPIFFFYLILNALSNLTSTQSPPYSTLSAMPEKRTIKNRLLKWLFEKMSKIDKTIDGIIKATIPWERPYSEWLKRDAKLYIFFPMFVIVAEFPFFILLGLLINQLLQQI